MHDEFFSLTLKLKNIFKSLYGSYLEPTDHSFSLQIPSVDIVNNFFSKIDEKKATDLHIILSKLLKMDSSTDRHTLSFLYILKVCSYGDISKRLENGLCDSTLKRALNRILTTIGQYL